MHVVVISAPVDLSHIVPGVFGRGCVDSSSLRVRSRIEPKPARNDLDLTHHARMLAAMRRAGQGSGNDHRTANAEPREPSFPARTARAEHRALNARRFNPGQRRKRSPFGYKIGNLALADPCAHDPLLDEQLRGLEQLAIRT